MSCFFSMSFVESVEQLSTVIQSIDIPPNAPLQELESIYGEIVTSEELCSALVRCGGETAWLRGAVLNALKPIGKGKVGIAKHGEWQKFLKKFRISADTAENLRHINRRFSRNEARQMGYSEMVETYKAEKQMEKNAGETENSTGSDRKKRSALAVTDADGMKNPKNIGKSVSSIAAASRKLVTQVEAMPVEAYQGAQQYSAFLRALPTDIDGAIRNLVRAAVVLHDRAKQATEGALAEMVQDWERLCCKLAALEETPETVPGKERRLRLQKSKTAGQEAA